MARGFWNRVMRRGRNDAVKREAEREQMSSAEQHFAAQDFEDHQADEFVSEHLGGVELDRSADDEPPRT
jgi:hypothetical protein